MDRVNLGFRRKDESVTGLVLVKSAQVKVSSNGSAYLDLTVMDSTGEMNAKIWNWGDAQAPATDSPLYIRGLVHEFMGKLQLRIDKMRDATEEEIDWSILVPCAPEPAAAMFNELYQAASGLGNKDLSALCCHMLERDKEKLLLWPAAVSYHHAERAGLLYHTVTMLRAAKALLPIYPNLNGDLVLCGVILHDLCKMDELNASALGLAADYTPKGMLLGHLVLGVAKLETAGRQLGTPPETLLLVQHMILSHHETPEFGSPRPPMFPEAELLHHLDVLDARMYEMRHALDSTPDGCFSERVRSLENRKLYKPSQKEE